MAVKTVTSASFADEVLMANVPVLVDFYADWCGPCRMLRPTLEAISEERADVKVAAINIDENPDLADEFGISSIPCVILFKNGAEADRSIGLIRAPLPARRYGRRVARPPCSIIPHAPRREKRAGA